MVTVCGSFVSIATVLFGAEQAAGPVLERLDPPRRAAVVMALLALTLVGIFLIVFVMIGGHWVRRMARHRPGKGRRASGNSAIEDRQVRQSLTTLLPEAKTDDTLHLGKSPKDTKVGR